MAQQAANVKATVHLVRGAAVAADATVYAGIGWTSVNTAPAARHQLAGLIEHRTPAAVYAAWQALVSIALQDLGGGRSRFRSSLHTRCRRHRQPWR